VGGAAAVTEEGPYELPRGERREVVPNPLLRLWHAVFCRASEYEIHEASIYENLRVHVRSNYVTGEPVFSELKLETCDRCGSVRMIWSLDV
jgi:hypothetical protein